MTTLYFRQLLIIVLCTLPACKSPVHGPKAGDPVVPPEKILADGFMGYKQDLLNLAAKFTPLDTAAHPISREAFLQAFASGDYLPLKVRPGKDSNTYRLYYLPDSTNKSVRNTIRYYGELYWQHYKREGETIPDFNFTDVNGVVYNKATLKDKTIDLKFWFIHCQACVEEMPELNRLVEEYREHKDVLFVSMAFDTKEQLQKFLKTTRFLYATIPVPEKFISEEMKISIYPTHMIIRNGVIQKIPDSYN